MEPRHSLKIQRRIREAALAIALVVSVASVCHAQPAPTNQNRGSADFTVQTWGYIAADFSARVGDYSALRSELEKGLPPLTVTHDSAEIRKAVRSLAERIRKARSEAKQGDIFTPTISREFRKTLMLEIHSDTWTAILDDNPGEVPTRINGTYPEGKPLSTVPSSILAVLPSLPDDIQYRFLARHLILLDTRANVILDRISFAICAPTRSSRDGGDL